jgi:hypothetical protein
MGVVISKPTINIREQLTELKAQQGYEERQFHFDNLVTNGTFDTDTSGWTAHNYQGHAVTISSVAGELTVVNDPTNGGTAAAYQSVPTVVGQTYSVSVDFISTTSGPPNVLIRNTLSGISLASITTSGAGTYTTTFTATATNTLVILNQNSTAAGITTKWDNVSVYEVDPNDSNKVIHTMPKGWKPLHVFEDGALQREGSAYDYTVEYDGFNYIVKETVAPVAPYSTTVIGVRA